MYAIVRTGGKQYRVEEGRTVTVERLPLEQGATAELGEVLLIADDGEVTVGTPTIDGARVLAEVEAHGRDKKIVVFKYKSKVRTRKKAGHRQHFTRLAVQEILRPGQESKVAKPKPRRRAAKKDEGAAETPALEAQVAAPAAEAPARAPRRRTRTTATAAVSRATVAKSAAPKRRTPRKAATPEASGETPGAEAPKRRAVRRSAKAKEGVAPEGSAAVKTPAPRRRRTAKDKETE